MHLRILYLIIIFQIAARFCNAQNLPEPKKVFKENYASEILAKAQDRKIVKIQTKKNDSSQIDKAGNSDKDESFISINPDEEKENNQEVKNPFENSAGEKVVWLGSIIYAGNPEHFTKSLEEFTDVAIKYDFMLGPVFILGNPDYTILNQYIGKIQKRQGIVDFRKEVPSKYKDVKMSPAWIVQTPKGQVLFEATGPLKNNFNKKGEVVIP